MCKSTSESTVISKKGIEGEEKEFFLYSIQRQQQLKLRIIYRGTTYFCLFMVFWILVLPSSALQDVNIHPVLNHARDEFFNYSTFLPQKLSQKFSGQYVIHLTHILPAALWAGIIPFQLHPMIRKKYRTLHKVFGYLFLLVCVLMSIGFVMILRRGLLFENFMHGDDDGENNSNITVNTVNVEDENKKSSVKALETPLILFITNAWFLWTAFKAVIHARNKRFELHQKYFIRHVASGIWVSIQRNLIMWIYPILLILFNPRIGIFGENEKNKKNASLELVRRHLFPTAAKLGLLIAVVVSEYSIHLLDDLKRIQGRIEREVETAKEKRN